MDENVSERGDRGRPPSKTKNEEPETMKTKNPGITPFQHRVYAALRCVPKGRVTTYGLLARHLGCRSAQAVGQALRCNPFAPEVPCHRVIAANLGIGGFQGARSGAKIRRKLRLLAVEGVAFDSRGRLVEEERVFAF